MCLQWGHFQSWRGCDHPVPSMPSKLLGKTDLDPQLAEKEAQRILQFESTDECSEFTFGTWRSCVLWNESGDETNTILRQYPGPAQRTPLAAKLPYLASVLERTFVRDSIKRVRVFHARDGLLAPHRNLMESGHSFGRLSFPLRTDIRCLHSEEEFVFHLRLGEVWHIDEAAVHSACTPSNFSRVLVCVDFDLPGGSFESVFRDQGNPSDLLEPLVPNRSPIEGRFLEVVRSIGVIIDWHNVRDILQLLARVHFYYDISTTTCYDWLIQIAAQSQVPKLLDKATDFRRFCVGNRDPYETFEWRPDADWARSRISGP